MQFKSIEHKVKIWFEKLKQYAKLGFDQINNAKLKYSDMSAEEIEKGWMYAKDADGNPYSPAWATLNFKVKYSVFANMELTAGLENITDVRYKPYASGLVAPGRNFFMAVKASF